MKNMLKNKNTRTNMITYGVVILAFLLMQGMSAADMLGSSIKGFLIPICVYISLAVSLNLLVGVCGELSLGHAGFMGLGAFSGVVIAALLKDVVDSEVLRLVCAMLGGGIIAGVASVIIGIPVLRLRGDYLAIVTLAFGEILKNLIGNLYIGRDVKGVHFAFNSADLVLGEGGKKILSGPMGATGVQKIASFPMGFVLVLLTLFVVLNLIDSKEGRAIKAVRGNRIAAESVGINVTSFRLKAFVVSAFLAGMAGALYGLNYSSLTASKFNFNTSINILVFVVLGGMGNILGSVVSATVLYVLPEAMRELEDYRMLLYAVVLIIVMLFTWSPKVKDKMAVLTAKVSTLFKKKEVGTNE
ncbi:MAG: branched-chain amino acid ABC transporter permease [Oscillospiraceae bacterium]|nr:branched-chain amino acid ABC transporter permease [Oscillospiraceae bacterium]